MHMNVGYFLIISEIIKNEWIRTIALCIHMNVGYFLIISEIIKSEWTRTVALCIHMNVGYFLIISGIIKSELTRTVALCIHTNVGYFLIISEIIKILWIRTVALCIYMSVGFFFVRLNTRGGGTRLHSTSNEDQNYRKASFRFLTTGQKFLLCCQSDVAVRKVESTPEFCSGGYSFECRPGPTFMGDVFCRFTHLLKMNALTAPYIRPQLHLP